MGFEYRIYERLCDGCAGKFIGNVDGCSDESREYAKLLSTAPELLEALMAAYDTINYLGDILNDMDCVSPEDEDYTTPRIELIKDVLEKLNVNTKSQEDLTEIVEVN